MVISCAGFNNVWLCMCPVERVSPGWLYVWVAWAGTPTHGAEDTSGEPSNAACNIDVHIFDHTSLTFLGLHAIILDTHLSTIPFTKLTPSVRTVVMSEVHRGEAVSMKEKRFRLQTVFKFVRVSPYCADQGIKQRSIASWPRCWVRCSSKRRI